VEPGGSGEHPRMLGGEHYAPVGRPKSSGGQPRLSVLLRVVRWVSKVPSVRDGAPVNARRRSVNTRRCSVEPGGSGECPEALGERPGDAR